MWTIKCQRQMLSFNSGVGPPTSGVGPPTSLPTCGRQNELNELNEQPRKLYKPITVCLYN